MDRPVGIAHVGLLGPFEVRVDGHLVALGGHRQRATLALLAIHANEVVSSDELVDRLWCGEPPAGAATTLRVYLSHLRRAVAGSSITIDTHRPGYVLVADPERIDARRFEHLVADARVAAAADNARRAAVLLREALSLWRGPALVDFTYEPFAETEIARLEELRLAALEARVDAELALGAYDDVIPELDVLVSANPLREGFRAQLMRALHAVGRRPEALRVYQRGRETLVEMGLEPGAALQRLEQAILLQDPDLEPGDGAPPAATGNLPVPITSFVGRAREVDDVRAIVVQHRLTSITGAGGSGKTRLAREVAAQLDTSAATAAWLVELGALTDPGLVPAAVSTALGVREQPGRPLVETLVDALRRRDDLLVVDNCEHVVDAVAALVDHLLPRCPGVRVLATSREPLGVAGEMVWPIPTLPVPDAVRLFVERATAASPRFRPTDADLPAITRICRRLDGMPLAIELAAARLRLLSLDEIAARLDDRFHLLAAGSRTAVARHRTLRATVEWSYDLLDDRERTLFARLGAFAGSFTVAGAEAVCGHHPLAPVDILDLLDNLVAKSLITRVDTVAGEARFRMLETLTEYARSRLREAEETTVVRRAHAAWCTRVAEDAAPRLHRTAASDWRARLDADHDDIRHALEWLVTDGQPDDALRLTAAMWPYWEARFHIREGRQWLARALARPGSSPEARIAALVGAAFLASLDDDLDGAKQACDEGGALAGLLGDEHRRAQLLVVLAEVVRHRDNDAVAAEARCREAVDVLERERDGYWTGQAKRVLTLLAWDRGDLARAEGLAEDCLLAFEDLGDVDDAAGAQALLATLARARGDLGRANELYEQSLAKFQLANEPWGTAQVTRMLGALAVDQGDHERAFRLASESRRLHEVLGLRRGIAEATKVMADAELGRGNVDAADALCADALAGFRERGFVVDVTSALHTAARVALARGDLERAARLCEEALEPCRRGGYKRGAAEVLCVLAEVRARQGWLDAANDAAIEAKALFAEAGDQTGYAAATAVVAAAP